MSDAQPPDEVLDAGEDRIISLSYGREWPRYAVHWAVRVQRGDRDYPLGGDTIVAMPPRDGEASAVWSDLRDRAMHAAEHVISSRASSPPAERKSLIGRLFGRRTK